MISNLSEQRPPPGDEADAIPVTEEQLHVGRRVTDTGRTLRVRKHVDVESVDTDASVAHERVDVERVPVGRVVSEPPVVRQEGDVTVVPVVEERLVTRKELVLVEEIRLTRRREEAPARARVDLRRERVEIERFDPDTRQWHPEAGAAAPTRKPKEQ